MSDDRKWWPEEDVPQYRLRPLLPRDAHTAQEFYEATRPLLDGPALDGTDSLHDNRRRASFAAEALATYGRRTGVGTGESVFLAVQDLLSDMRHLLDLAQNADSDGYPKTLDELVEKSATHYQAEIRGEL